MADDAMRKAVVLEYCRLINAGDLEGVLALFAPEIRFVDPVGTPPIVGREALRDHLGKAIDAHIREEPGTPTGSLDGESVALPMTGTMDAPDGGRIRFNLISLIRVNGAGLITEVRIFAGRTDFALLDTAG